MSDLITREDAISVKGDLKKIIGLLFFEPCDTKPNYLTKEITMCRDCRYNYGLESGDGFYKKDIVCTYFETDGMDQFDFCSFGERSEKCEEGKN